MALWLLVDDYNDALAQLDSCTAGTKREASHIFDKRGWMIGEVISHEQFQNELQEIKLEIS